MNSRPDPQFACIYRRVSTDHQDGSLEVQEKRIDDYLHYKVLPDGRKLTLHEGLTYSDPDVSGSKPLSNRKGGMALLNRLKCGDVKHLVVAKLDRLGRNTQDFLATLAFLNRHGVTLHIVDFGGDSMSTQGYMGKLVLTIIAAVAEAELCQIRDRVQQRADLLFARNELTGKVPFGFDAQYTFADGHVETRNVALAADELRALRAAHGGEKSSVQKILIDNPAEQHWIRQAAAWRGDTLSASIGERDGVRCRSLSYKAIADQLNAAGVLSKTGKPWCCGKVESVLKSRHSQRLLQTPEGLDEAA